MPAFITPTAQLPLSCLYPGASLDVFSAEAVTNGEYSQAVALSNYPVGSATPLSLNIQFSAAPGAFTFNVVFSDHPNQGTNDFSMPDTTYQVTAANLDPANGVSLHLQIPFSNSRAVALYVSSKPANAVTLTATFKR
jgi:hypothetical protein